MTEHDFEAEEARAKEAEKARVRDVLAKQGLVQDDEGLWQGKFDLDMNGKVSTYRAVDLGMYLQPHVDATGRVKTAKFLGSVWKEVLNHDPTAAPGRNVCVVMHMLHELVRLGVVDADEIQQAVRTAGSRLALLLTDKERKQLDEVWGVLESALTNLSTVRVIVAAGPFQGKNSCETMVLNSDSESAVPPEYEIVLRHIPTCDHIFAAVLELQVHVEEEQVEAEDVEEEQVEAEQAEEEQVEAEEAEEQVEAEKEAGVEGEEEKDKEEEEAGQKSNIFEVLMAEAQLRGAALRAEVDKVAAAHRAAKAGKRKRKRKRSVRNNPTVETQAALEVRREERAATSDSVAPAQSKVGSSRNGRMRLVPADYAQVAQGPSEVVEAV